MAAKTSISINTGVQVTATTGVGFSIVIDPATSGIPKNVQTYMLTVVNDGATRVDIHPAGTNDLTSEVSGHRVQPSGGEKTIGPLNIKDERYRLWSSADSICVIQLDPVTGEA